MQIVISVKQQVIDKGACFWPKVVSQRPDISVSYRESRGGLWIRVLSFSFRIKIQRPDLINVTPSTYGPIGLSSALEHISWFYIEKTN